MLKSMRFVALRDVETDLDIERSQRFSLRLDTARAAHTFVCRILRTARDRHHRQETL